MLDKNSIKKIGLAAATVLIFFLFLASGNLTHAQSINYHDYELLRMLENLFPELLSPAPQITKLQDGGLYRTYSDTGITIKTKGGQLYVQFSPALNDEYICDIEAFCYPFAQAEVFFNSAESAFPDLFPPQVTQVAEGGIFYRAYPNGITLQIVEGNLSGRDGPGLFGPAGDEYPLGRVASWLESLGALGFEEEPLDGLYRIQQKQTKDYKWYVDSYTSGGDYALVLRADGGADDQTQQWIIKPLGNDVYTIQQKATPLWYVDAYTSGGDYALVRRAPGGADDDTQKWIIKPLGNGVYTIQHAANNRYVDAYTDMKDYALVTRPYEDNDTQKWIITFVPEDMSFEGVYYDLDEAEVGEVHPLALDRMTFLNCTSTDKSQATTEQTWETDEKSWFIKKLGFELGVERQLSVGVPVVKVGGKIELRTSIEWTWGKEVTFKHMYTYSFTLEAPAWSCVRGEPLVLETALSVPYIMFFKSTETGAIRVSKGVWEGLPTHDAYFSQTQEEDLCDCANTQQQKELCGCPSQ